MKQWMFWSYIDGWIGFWLAIFLAAITQDAPWTIGLFIIDVFWIVTILLIAVIGDYRRFVTWGEFIPAHAVWQFVGDITGTMAI